MLHSLLSAANNKRTLQFQHRLKKFALSAFVLSVCVLPVFLFSGCGGNSNDEATTTTLQPKDAVISQSDVDEVAENQRQESIFLKIRQAPIVWESRIDTGNVDIPVVSIQICRYTQLYGNGDTHSWSGAAIKYYCYCPKEAQLDDIHLSLGICGYNVGLPINNINKNGIASGKLQLMGPLAQTLTIMEGDEAEEQNCQIIVAYKNNSFAIERSLIMTETYYNPETDCFAATADGILNRAGGSDSNSHIMVCPNAAFKAHGYSYEEETLNALIFKDRTNLDALPLCANQFYRLGTESGDQIAFICVRNDNGVARAFAYCAHDSEKTGCVQSLVLHTQSGDVALTDVVKRGSTFDPIASTDEGDAVLKSSLNAGEKASATVYLEDGSVVEINDICFADNYSQDFTAKRFGDS